jgi:hypothetical protein
LSVKIEHLKYLRLPLNRTTLISADLLLLLRYEGHALRISSHDSVDNAPCMRCHALCYHCAVLSCSCAGHSLTLIHRPRIGHFPLSLVLTSGFVPLVRSTLSQSFKASPDLLDIDIFACFLKAAYLHPTISSSGFVLNTVGNCSFQCRTGTGLLRWKRYQTWKDIEYDNPVDMPRKAVAIAN